MNSNELDISTFNKENCKTGIVHLGVGNFHKAHQANYVNEYLNTSNNLNWGICGINLRKEENLITYPSISRAKKLLKWRPKINFRLGLSKTIRFYEKNSR